MLQVYAVTAGGAGQMYQETGDILAPAEGISGIDERLAQAPLSEPVAPGVSTAALSAGTRLTRRRVAVLAGIVLLWVLVYLVVYVPARGNGSDFQDFYAAAYADAHGIDVYNWPSLWRVEQFLYDGGVGHNSSFAFVPFGNPPPFALLLRPLIGLAESDAYRIWAMLVLLTSACGAYLGLTGWPRDRRLPAALLAACSPAALFNVRLGQSPSVILLGLGLAIWLVASRRPVSAGMALSLGLIKPHLGLPLAVILICALTPADRRRAAIGFIGAASGWVMLAVVADGGIGVFGRWWASIHGYLGSIRLQPDVASIPGIYYGGAPAGAIGLLNGLCLATAASLVAALAWHGDRGQDGLRWKILGGGMAVYFALSPYVHTGDQVLLALPLLWLVGPNGSGLRDSAVWLAGVTALVAPMVVFRNYHTVGINALPPVCLALAYAIGAPRTGAAPARHGHEGVPARMAVGGATDG